MAIGQLEKVINMDQISKDLHPYFQKQSRLKLEKSLEEIRILLEGNNYTNPHRSDTFGIDGILLTKDNGTIKATSVVPDYWNDPFADKYLEVQKELIDVKKVNIQRIFIFPQKDLKKAKLTMNRQKEIGIDVRYIYSESEFANKDYLKEDYLIQDDEILVHIDCGSHKAINTDVNVEYITTNKTKIAEMKGHFNILYDRSIKFKK